MNHEKYRRKLLIAWGILIPAELQDLGRSSAVHKVAAIVFSAEADIDLGAAYGLNPYLLFLLRRRPRAQQIPVLGIKLCKSDRGPFFHKLIQTHAPDTREGLEPLMFGIR